MNIVITGASRGIGYQTALAFASAGHVVVAISRNEERLMDLKRGAEHKAFSGQIIPLVKDLAQIDGLNLEIKEKIDSVDILINNAGSLLNKPFASINLDDLQSIYNVNVFAPFLTIQKLLDLFSDNAHIINIGSVGGINDTQKFPGLSAYSSSKGALSIMTECLQAEYQGETNFTFNCLALGAVRTEMLKEAFPEYEAEVSPEEMGKYIYEFALNAPSVIRGKTINVSRSNP